MMRTVSTFCVAAAFACAFAVNAQEPTTKTKQAGKSPAAAKKTGEARTLTLTGCLQQGSDANTYTLTNVAVDMRTTAAGSQGTTGSGTSGAAAGSRPTPRTATTSGSAKPTWTLAPERNVDLAAHLGHRVQVTGTTSGDTRDETMKSETKSAGTAKTSAGETKSEQTAKGELTMSAQKLTVTTIKHISDTCAK